MNVQRLTDMIVAHEGCELHPYKDSKGIMTIGVGRNLDDRGITEEEAKVLLLNDIAIVDQELKDNFNWYNGLSEARKAAMIDLAFNMGLPTLKQFRKTLSFLELGLYDEAGDELLVGSGPDGKSRYYADVGKRAETISGMIKTGEW